MRAAKAAKDVYHQVTHGIAEHLESFINSPNSAMVEFVVESLIPLLTMVINEVCYAMPKDPGAFLAMRLLERHAVPEPLLLEVREWLFKKNGLHSPNDYSLMRRTEHLGDNMIMDGDASGGGTGGTSLQPQPPQARRGSDEAAKQSPKVKQVAVSPDKAEKEKEKQKQQLEEEETAEGDDHKHVHIWENVEAEEEESDSSGDETEDPEKQATMRKLRKSLGPGQDDPNRRKSANPNVDSRRRRFTVNISSVSVPPPAESICLDLISQVPFFQDFTAEEQKKLCAAIKCNRYETGEIIANCGCVSDHVHMIVEGTAKVCEPKEIGRYTKSEFFGEEAVKFPGAISQTQISADGQLTTISISQAAFNALNLKAKLKKVKEGKKARGAKTTAVTLSSGHLAPREMMEDHKDGICGSTGRPIVEYQQTDFDKELIKNAVHNNKVLGEVLNLSPAQYDILCDAVYLIQIERGEILMATGDKGNCLYIVQDGLLDVHIGDEKSYDIKIRPGDSFGELALLYDTPRAATIEAAHTSQLWVLLRKDFKVAIRMNYSDRISQYCKLLLQVPCLKDLADESNIDMIAGVLEETSFLDGEEICVEGEDAGALMILFQGTADVLQDSKVVRRMAVGEWVGEDCLMQYKTADVTVKVTSDEAVVLVLDDASLNVVVKAISEIKKAGVSSRLSVTGSGMAAQLNPYLDHLDKENFADEVLKKKMSRLTKGMTLGGRPEDDKDQIDFSKLSKVGVLGEGSFGTVLLMKDQATQKNYALKGLLKEQIRSENMGQSVANERQVMILLDSDFVTRLYGTWQDGTYIYLLQEPVMGGELFDVYNSENLFGNLVNAKFYIACCTFGLAHMHSKRVIYRDLKLENCLMDPQGYVKLTDMGIAKMVVGKTYTVCGTADYFAPETLKQTGHNRGVDWWALGVLLFIMCSGRSPFDAPDVTQIYKNIIKGFSKVKFPDNFPSDLMDVIKSLCRKAPEERITMQKGGAENLKQMPFFTKLDWDLMESRELPAPFIPDEQSEEQFAAKTLSRRMDIDQEQLSVWDGGLPSGL
mmetsp:Transcript_79327/g.140003  ORF Transcript_79327/g.140003 Transcript_79327/m.140003 type:complete len:1046 (-) Transcript_79327:104-3241(-)